MTLQANEFACLLKRAAQGDQAAWTQLFDLYEPRLIGIVGRRLQKIPSLRTRFDAEDFALPAWAVFFNRFARREPDISSEQLIGLLTRIALRRLAKTARQHLGTQKRDLHKKRSLRDAVAVVDSSPTPDRIVQSTEDWNRWLQTLPAKCQQVAQLLRDGFHAHEIAALLSCSMRTVERMTAEIHNHPPT